MATLLLIIAVIITIAWIYLAINITKDDVVEITIAKRKNAAANVKRITKEERKKIAALIKSGSDEDGKDVKKIQKKYAKKIAEAQKNFEKANNSAPGIMDIMPACGYVVMRKFGFNADNKMFRQLVDNFTRTDGKENAFVRAKHLFASTISYAVIGVMVDASVISIMMSMENEDAALMGLIILILVAVVCYIPLSNLRQEAQYREERIEAEFPNVVSKLAMLINSGMEVSKAWELTANSSEDVLYEEMQVVVALQDSNVSPASAYTQFMNNCNNKYTSKLATSIMQNLSKGNEEIGLLFMQMSSESWMERKHNAKRLGEKAQSNLLIPTIMIFLGIMVLVIVPIFADMGGTFG